MKKYRIGRFEFDIYTILLFVLTLAGAVIRLWDLDQLTLWVDEYVHVDRARFFPEQPLLTDDNNGILLTLFIIPLFKLFGVSEFWARFPSVMFGTLLIPAVWFLAKRLFNRNIALTAATLVTFSTYLTFWSRLSRNYAIFAFFFIVLLYFLARALSADPSFREGKNRLLNYLELQPRYLWMALVALVLSIASHQLALLFVYGLMGYYLLLFIDGLCRGKRSLTSFEAIVSYLFVLFSLIIFIPAVHDIFRSFFLLFMPTNVANWVVPDLGRLGQLIQTNPYGAFDIYNGVLKTDYAALYLPAIAGFVCALIRFRRQGYYLVAMFGVLFAAMSFIFREPSLPRYLIYIYPLFLIAIACAFDTAFVVLAKMKLRVKPLGAAIISMLVILCLPTVRTTLQTVSGKQHGQVVAPQLSAFYFPDWKTSLRSVKSRLGKDDVLISTMPTYVNFYLGRSSYWFRQKRYNAATHQYENWEVDLINPNAHSTQALAALLADSPRAWLLVDYYFDNVMTDPQTRDFVIRNMKFEFAISNDYVSVFSWDRSQPKPDGGNAMFEFLRSTRPGSSQYRVDLPAVSNMYVYLDMEGIVRDNQALLRINGHIFPVRREQGSLWGQNSDSRVRQTYRVQVPANAFNPGENLVSFVLNQPKNSVRQGGDRFVVYDMGFEPAR